MMRCGAKLCHPRSQDDQQEDHGEESDAEKRYPKLP